jgi:hypothetical protein
MGRPSGTAPDEAPRPEVREAEERSGSERPAPATVLLLAIWIGLTAGFLDLGGLVVRKCLIDGEFYRLGHGFPWIIPTGVATLVLVPGVALALVARLRRRGVPLGIAVGLPAFVGFLDLTAMLPLELWSSLLLSAGLAVQSARLVRPRRLACLRLARIMAPLLAGVVLALALATSGAQVWSEHRTSASLLPPPPAARNVILVMC